MGCEMICEQCQGDLVILGVLGNLAHFRCRHCGAECSKKLEPEELEEIKEAIAD